MTISRNHWRCLIIEEEEKGRKKKKKKLLQRAKLVYEDTFRLSVRTLFLIKNQPSVGDKRMAMSLLRTVSALTSP